MLFIIITLPVPRYLRTLPFLAVPISFSFFENVPFFKHSNIDIFFSKDL